MGIPRFYRWLKEKYQQIRIDLKDLNKQIPEIDNFYIDFNALIYRCVQEQGTFLRNKIIPLTIADIYLRVMDYFQELLRAIKPGKVLFIGLDGVAPRAKINQSRDRRFRAIKDQEMFQKLLEQAGLKNKQNFKRNSISPGTQFLNTFCQEFKRQIMNKLQTQWRHLKVFYSDCTCPGQGQHKIIDFFRYSNSINLFPKDTTYCVYSPDADVILLTLGLGIKYICLIKQDTTLNPSVPSNSVQRYYDSFKFELVLINILSQYLEKQFMACLKAIPGSTIQDIINDFILLMGFVGNDFLPSEFCFTLKDNHMDRLYQSYKEYMLNTSKFINKKGHIDWENIGQLLKIATKFEAGMLQQKIRNHKATKNNPNYNAQKQQQQQLELQQYQVVDNTIIKGKQKYYKNRFNITDIKHNNNPDPKFIEIIQKYIQGLEFYCLYYLEGLPSWNWYYPYHYTPLLSDVYQYLKTHKINTKLSKSTPFDPFLALMFMLPQGSFCLLPTVIENKLKQPDCQLRSPNDYYPLKFQLDKYQTIQYSKRALIEFLPQQKVRIVYQSIKRQEYSKNELERNKKSNPILFYVQKGEKYSKVAGIQLIFNQETANKLLNIFKNNKNKQGDRERFPGLDIYGNWNLNQKGSISTNYQYKHTGNPSQIIFFNNFQGYIEDYQKCPENLKLTIEKQYEKIGISGNCDMYYIVRQARYVRNINCFQLVRSRNQVLVPDFIVHKVPKYSYIKRPKQFSPRQLYEVGDRVSILNQQNFGCIGLIQKLQQKYAQIKIVESGYRAQQKLQQCTYDFNIDNQQFYNIEYAIEKLDISQKILLAILDDIIILPSFGKKQKQLKQFLPTAVNFGLGFINIGNMKIVPEYIRCQMIHQNTQRPKNIFNTIQISQKCIKILERYIEMYSWLIQYLQSTPGNIKKSILASEIFNDQDTDSNAKLLQQYAKLFQLKHQGFFYSIYSKIGNKQVTFIQCERPKLSQIQLKYHQFISQKQANLSPPALRLQPQYHDVGDRIVYLKTLQVGYIIGVDDNMVYIKLAKSNRPKKVSFVQIFNEKWVNYLQKDEPTVWDLQLSYYTPTYWRKAINN